MGPRRSYRQSPSPLPTAPTLFFKTHNRPLGNISLTNLVCCFYQFLLVPKPNPPLASPLYLNSAPLFAPSKTSQPSNVLPIALHLQFFAPPLQPATPLAYFFLLRSIFTFPEDGLFPLFSLPLLLLVFFLCCRFGLSLFFAGLVRFRSPRSFKTTLPGGLFFSWSGETDFPCRFLRL